MTTVAEGEDMTGEIGMIGTIDMTGMTSTKSDAKKWATD